MASSNGHDILRFGSTTWTIPGVPDLHQTAAATGSKQIKIKRLTRSTSDGSPDLHRTAGVLSRRTTIDARSWPDHGPITPRLSPIATSEATFMEAPSSQLHRHSIKARSPRDRGLIAARSCPRSGLIQCQN